MLNGDYRYLAIAQSATTADLAAAVAGRRLRLVSLFLQVDTANATLTFLSGGTTIGSCVVNSGDGFVLPGNGAGWLQTAAGESLRLTVSAGAVKGFCTVQVLPP